VDYESVYTRFVSKLCGSGGSRDNIRVTNSSIICPRLTPERRVRLKCRKSSWWRLDLWCRACGQNPSEKYTPPRLDSCTRKVNSILITKTLLYDF
jgi:hypothetical protein